MLALALLPTLSRAMAHGAGGAASWAEICTPQGMKLVALDALDVAPGEPAAPAQAGHHLDHCPYCSLAGQALGLPPAPVVAPALVLAAGHEPPLFLQAPRTLHAWRSAQPRAPPLNP